MSRTKRALDCQAARRPHGDEPTTAREQSFFRACETVGAALLLTIAGASICWAAPQEQRFTEAQWGSQRTSFAPSATVTVERRATSPWLTLEDGRPLHTELGDGNLAGKTRSVEVEALSLTSDDLDGDGVPDLVVGYREGSRGAVVLHRGDPAALHPYLPGAEERGSDSSPFLSPARRFIVAEPAELVAGGDFDNDGHRDVLTAAYGSNRIFVLPGDGRGDLAAPEELLLPGRLTAAVVGEVNRRDGIADLVVAVEDADGVATLLVYEGPAGVLAAEPEVVVLPAPATSLVLDRLSGELLFDVAAAVGSEIVVVEGRDRRLTVSSRSAVRPEPRTARLVLEGEIAALATGNLLWESQGVRRELAVLGHDGSVVVVPREKIAAALEEREALLPQEDLHVLEQALQSSPGPRQLISGHVSLLAADELLVLDPVRSELRLHLTGPEPPEVANGLAKSGRLRPRRPVTLQSDAPPVAALALRLSPDALADLVVLTEGAAEPVVLIAKAGGGSHLVNRTGLEGDGDTADGLCDIDLNTPELECTVNAAFTQIGQASMGSASITFDGPGIYQHSSTKTFTIPVTIDGSSQSAGGAPTVELTGGLTMRFNGGSSIIRGVILSGTGVWSFGNAGQNRFEGNHVGVDSSGGAKNPRGSAQQISSFNAAAGPTTFKDNVIVANTTSSTGLVVQGNGDVVQGNRLGTDTTGTVALGDRQGQGLSVGGAGATVGGTGASHANVISGNFNNGVIINGDGVLFQGNRVGTDLSGSSALPNQASGVTVQGFFPFPNMVTIGGTAPGAGNVISSNGFSRGEGGLKLVARNARVEGNRIGTDATGTVALGNRGIAVDVAGSNNTIGGSAPGAGNVIAATVLNPGTQRARGIWISGSSTIGTVVEGNLIGVGLGGGALGNEGNGVDISNSTTNNRIGGTGPGAGNVIANSGGTGVIVEGGGSSAGDGNAILGNSIFGNGGLAIDLSNSFAPNGPNLNDAGDPDGGPNEGQNFPVITTVAGNVQGSLNSLPGETYRIELFSSPECDPSGFGEAELFLAATEVTTDGSGNADFDVAVGAAANVVTATATHMISGQPRSTSELSVCVTRPGLVVNSGGDAPDLAPGNGFCDTGGVVARSPGAIPAKGVISECTLRAAIQEANANPDPFFDFIKFDPGLDLSFFVQIGAQPLPAIQTRLTIDGALPGGKKTEIRGGAGDGLTITGAASGSVLSNLHITDFAGNGVVLSFSNDNEITDCVIGIDRLGSPRPNSGHGILIDNGNANFIGLVKGPTPIGDPRVRGNTISGNLGDGIRIDGGNDNVVQGNRIGTSEDGRSSPASHGNGGNGVTVRAGALDNRIGGFAPATANVISGNEGEGVLVSFSADDTVIEGNLIGTDITGTVKLPNEMRGVLVEDPDTFGTVIANNVISGNLLEGIGIDNAQETDVSGNSIGTDRTGTLDLGNSQHGVALCCGAQETRIGPPGNTIAFNGGHGIVLTGNDTVNNRFDLNRIHSNVGLGIDLGGDGVTLNDAGDGDPGPNRRQNFPLVTSYTPQGDAVGSMSSTPLTSFLVELFLSAECDPTGYGEAETLAGFATVVTDASGVGTWTATPGVDPDRPFLTAIATRRQFEDIDLPTLIDSSEISSCYGVEAGAPTLLVNEVDAQPAAASQEFVELFYSPGAALPLAGKVVVLYDGATDTSYAAFDLDGFSTGGGGFFVLGNAGAAGVDLVFADDLLLDGPAAVALYDGNATDFPNGTPVTTSNLLDAVVYGGGGSDFGLLPLLAPAERQVDEAAAGDATRDSLQRCGDGSGGARRTATFAPAAPTPATSAACATCQLTPPTDQGGTTDTHTVAALVRVDGADPGAAVEVNFAVASGPNSGTATSATTDNAGVATFTYTGGGSLGLDLITAEGSVQGRPFTCSATRSFGSVEIFTDGFESGDLSAWSSSVGGN